ncbi:unnamed protein product [Citrullus colocynthis]|uniref:Uncharacterized protein n=1 Tax=Citrullus colocynthis TaxID=252529 RepID=A0ABP0XP28_9ROSI
MSLIISGDVLNGTTFCCGERSGHPNPILFQLEYQPQTPTTSGGVSFFHEQCGETRPRPPAAQISELHDFCGYASCDA